MLTPYVRITRSYIFPSFHWHLEPDEGLRSLKLPSRTSAVTFSPNALPNVPPGSAFESVRSGANSRGTRNRSGRNASTRAVGARSPFAIPGPRACFTVRRRTQPIPQLFSLGRRKVDAPYRSACSALTASNKRIIRVQEYSRRSDE